MATNTLQDSYRNVKLYTDYDLDFYQPLGASQKKGSHHPIFNGSCLKPAKSEPEPAPAPESEGTLQEKKRNVPYLQYKPCVSFDTVPVSSSASKDSLIEKEYPSYDFPGVQIPPELYTMDEWYDNESGYATNDNTGYFIHNEYLTDNNSNDKSEHRRSRSPTRIKSAMTLRKMQNMFKLTPSGKIVREDYPSRPTVDNDAMIINRAYGSWSHLWNQKRMVIDSRLLERSENFQHPELLFPDLIAAKNPKGVSDDTENDPEYQSMTRKEKKKWQIMNRVVGYPNSPKTILCHISGRKHTWVGLDYTIMKLAQDTDHVVVLANLARLKKRTSTNTGLHRHHHSHHYNRRSRSVSRNEATTGNEFPGIDLSLTKVKSVDVDLLEKQSTNTAIDSSLTPEDYEGYEDEWASGYDRYSIEDKLNDILLYISVLLSKTPKSIKVTVEIVIGKSRPMLNEMVNVYMPDLFVLCKKKVTSEVRWKSIHLTDNFVKHSPVPVCVVFAKPMYQFELDLESEFSKKEVGNIKVSSTTIKHTQEQLDQWISSSIKSGSKMQRPSQPKVMKSMIEIALASDKKSSTSPTRLKKKKSVTRPTSPLRQSTPSLRPDMAHHRGVSVPGSIGVPLTKTRTISAQRPVKNWKEERNNLRRIKSNTPDDNISENKSGGLLSSLFKRRW